MFITVRIKPSYRKIVYWLTGLHTHRHIRDSNNYMMGKLL